MNEKDMMPVSVHEYDMARMERAIKRLWILLILLVAILFGTNLGWAIYENQYQDVVITQENETAPNSYIGNDGDIIYGQTDNKNPSEP